MLFDLRKLADLAAYIDAKDDKALLQWWAQFCESNGDFVSAVRYYNVAEDALSLVRLYCFNNDFNTVRVCAAHASDDFANLDCFRALYRLLIWCWSRVIAQPLIIWAVNTKLVGTYAIRCHSYGSVSDRVS
jgi:hypothetical protein